NYNADFLKYITARKGQTRLTIRPTLLIIKQYTKYRKTIEGVYFIKPKYINETEVNISGIFRK
ncbi:hypothetical protein F5883DRAFT_442730, partial [Diaporthe sp. PMI_573]